MMNRLLVTFLSFAFWAALAPVMGAPTYTPFAPRHEGNDTLPTNATSIQQKNGLAAQALNAQFANLTATDSCQTGSTACIDQKFAQCVAGTWALTPCTSGTTCVALPLVNNEGTALSCDSNDDALARFEAAGVQGGLTGNDDENCEDDNGTGGDENNNTNGGEEPCDDETTTAAPPPETPTPSGSGPSPTANGNNALPSPETTAPTVSLAPNGNEILTSFGTTTPTALPTPNGNQIVTSFGTTTPTADPTPPIAVANGNQILTSFGTTTPTPYPTPPANNYRRRKRQFVSITTFTTTPDTPGTTPSSSPPGPATVTVTALPPPLSSSAPNTTVIATNTSIPVTTPTSPPTGDPTSIAIGPDGIRTVTVFSTVTVGCGGSTVSPTTTTTSLGSIPTAATLPGTETVYGTNLPSSSPPVLGNGPAVTPVFSSPPPTLTPTPTPTPTTTTPQGGFTFTP